MSNLKIFQLYYNVIQVFYYQPVIKRYQISILCCTCWSSTPSKNILVTFVTLANSNTPSYRLKIVCHPTSRTF